MGTDRTTGFGRKLRTARERRGVSLRDIANKTKISVSVLEALERDDFSRLPGGIFGRAFVRSYAVEVGLDPDETIEEFLAQFPRDASVSAGHPRSEQVEDGEALEADRRMATTFMRLIGISAVLVGFLLYFASGLRRSPAPAPEEAPVAPVAQQPAVQQATAPAVATPDASAAGDPAAAPTREASSSDAVPATTAAAPASAPAGRLTIELVATEACWVSATADGNKVVEQLLQAGDTRRFDVQHEAVVTAGNAGALSITLNGAAAKPLGKAGQVVTARLNPSNYKDYLPRP